MKCESCDRILKPSEEKYNPLIGSLETMCSFCRNSVNREFSIIETSVSVDKRNQLVFFDTVKISDKAINLIKED